tara:strand:+ start:392 stop:628 length:237 start_codon:yes stop_codon:yes gene_type:complete
MRKNIIKNIIKKEIHNLKNNENYWGSEENVNNENTIYNYFLNENYVNQDWFDDRLKYTNVELLEVLQNIIDIKLPTNK